MIQNRNKAWPQLSNLGLITYMGICQQWRASKELCLPHSELLLLQGNANSMKPMPCSAGTAWCFRLQEQTGAERWTQCATGSASLEKIQRQPMAELFRIQMEKSYWKEQMSVVQEIQNKGYIWIKIWVTRALTKTLMNCQSLGKKNNPGI